MDAGLTVKPIGTAQAGYTKPEPLPVRAAVATDLAPSQTVTATQDGSATTTGDPSRNLSSRVPTTHEILIDPQTREVIFRVISSRTGQVIRQAPEEAMLKLEAYNRKELKTREADGNAVEKTA
jgi:uncharacterized FlaG/YvyC family protein